MANDYVNQIYSKINGIKSQISSVLKNLYVPKPIVSHARWLKSNEVNYINTISGLVKQYREVVETMKTNYWGTDYKTSIVNEFNNFIVGTNNQYNYFKDGYSSFFENMPFGKMKENMWNYLVQEHIIHKSRIESVNYQLKDGNYLSVMAIGFRDLDYSIWAVARDAHTTVEEFKEYKETYYTVCRFFDIDILCAELYLYHQLNKNKLIVDTLDEYFNSYLPKTQRELDILSSALEWMKNQYGLKIVLEYMEEELSLSSDRKARLSQLSNVKLDSFNITSGNFEIRSSISSMRARIKYEYSHLITNPMSYSIYLNDLKKESAPLYQYGPVDLVRSSLDRIKKENESTYLLSRDKLTNDEIKRLELMWANYYNFKNKNLKMIYPSLYFDNKRYNTEYMNEIMLLDCKSMKKKTDEINKILDSDVDEVYWNNVWNFDVKELMKYAWNIALNSNSDNYKEFGSQFVDVKALFYRLTRFFNIQMYLAELQQQINLFGKEPIQYKINTYLKDSGVEKSSNDLNELSSFLEFHQLLNEEKTILKLMVSLGFELSVYKAKRLNYLENYKEDGPQKLEVEHKGQLNFDVASIEWRENDVNEFFKQLDLNKQALDYSLAINLEDKDIIMEKGVKLPGLDEICKQINSDLDEEFDGEVRAQCKNATIISENIKEELEGIYLEIDDCPTMTLLVNKIKIGKKLNIRFYTLYTPTDHDINNQKNECMALIKKISPTISVWEKSVKETILLSLQHILNSNHNRNLNAIRNDDF